MGSRSAIVIGGGLAGLAAAGLLAQGGLRVTLLEAAPYLGGKSRRRSRWQGSASTPARSSSPS